MADVGAAAVIIGKVTRGSRTRAGHSGLAFRDPRLLWGCLCGRCVVVCACVVLCRVCVVLCRVFVALCMVWDGFSGFVMLFFSVSV